MSSTAGQASATGSALPDPLLPEEPAQEVAQRASDSLAGALSCLCMAVGHKLGLFAALKRLGPCTASDLAAATSLSERWVQEWLFQQVAARFVSGDKQAHRFWLSEGQAAVLVESTEDPKTTPLEMVCMVPSILGKSGELLQCFKTGQGLTFDDYGTEHMFYGHRIAKARHFVKQLQSLPGLHDRLTAGVKVADVGCGSGEIMLVLAATYPTCQCVGYDTSEQALQLARQRAADQGLTNLTFLNPQDGPEGRLPCQPTFHLVVVQDSLHDMSHPHEALKAIRQSMLSSSSVNANESSDPATTPPAAAGASGGEQADALRGYNGDPVLVVSDKAAMGDPATNITQLPAALLYGFSVGLCLGSGLSEDGGEGLGTLGFSQAVARKLSAAAGFTRYTALDWATSGDVNSYHMFRP